MNPESSEMDMNTKSFGMDVNKESFEMGMNTESLIKLISNHPAQAVCDRSLAEDESSIVNLLVQCQ